MVKASLFLLLLVSSTPEERSAARSQFELGVRHFRAERFAEALPHLKAAYRLSGRRASTVRALAQCHRALGELKEAVTLFREYVAIRPAPKDQRAIRRTIRYLSKKLRRRPGPGVLEGSERAEVIGLRTEEEAEGPGSVSGPVSVSGSGSVSGSVSSSVSGSVSGSGSLATSVAAPLKLPSSATPPSRRSNPTASRAAQPLTLAPEEDSLFQSPLFWIVSAGVVTAASIAIGFTVAGSAEDPYGGSTGILLRGAHP